MSDDLPEGLDLFDTTFDIDLQDDGLPTLPLDRPRHRPSGWWTTTPAESELLDYPDFNDGRERIRHMLHRMISAAIANGDATDWDDPVFPYHGKMATGHDLLATTDDHTDVMVGLATR